MKERYIKSPINYIGGFPLTIDNFNRFVLNGELHW